MKRSVPEEEYLDEEFEEYDDDYVYVDDDYSEPRKLRIEVILGLVAALCALVAAGLFFISPMLADLPVPTPEVDPEAALHGLHLREEEFLMSNPILETETEETVETTIPPESNPYDQYDFQYSKHNFLKCLRQPSYTGVDVSAFQHDIDWPAVKEAGVDFAIIRLGYRGYGAKGNMKEDEYAQQNLAGATAAGIPIGAYFFSQATNLEEVREEIDFMLEILGNYQLQYPIVLDWEVPYVEDGAPRTQNVDRRTLTELQKYFCDEMTLKGFDPMVYFNWNQASNLLYLNELEDYPFWLALYQDRMTFPYRVEMWQYTSLGRVPGIEGDVDINVYLPDER